MDAAYNPKKSRTYKEKALDKYADKVNEIMDKDPDIGLELAAGKKVKIIHDSEGDIEIPDYPNSDSNY